VDTSSTVFCVRTLAARGSAPPETKTSAPHLNFPLPAALSFFEKMTLLGILDMNFVVLAYLVDI
jgi:hypothetical protein